jgi:nucleotide-binding universal stress UspA family protein
MKTETATLAKKPYRIVVGFDLFETARNRAPAEVHVITAARPRGLLVTLPGYDELLTEEAARAIVERKLAEIVKADQEKKGPVGLEKISVYVLGDLAAEDPARLITSLARFVDADLIVVGTHGRKGVSRILLGSVAAGVVKDASTSVYVVRPMDFVQGVKVPEIEPPLAPGEPHLKHFEHRRTFHYVDRIPGFSTRPMPAS